MDLGKSSDLKFPPSWLALLVIAFATRALAIGNPILHVDEQFYFAAARGWAHGALPYVDIWDRKPVGLFLIYLLPAQLPFIAGIWAYQLMALASAWGTAMLIASMARRSGLARTGLVAGILYLVWIILAEGQGGQSPVFYNLLVAGAAWLVLEDQPERTIGPRRSRAMLAMLLFGLALQIKTSVLFEGVFFGLWILWRRWRGGDGLLAIIGLGTLMVALALIPTGIAMASYAAAGHFDAWWYANIVSITQRQPDPFLEQAGNLAGLTAILSPLVAMAVVALLRAGATPAQNMIVGWLASAVLAVLLFGSWFDHYGLPVMVPASIAASSVFNGDRRAVTWPTIALLTAALGGQILLAEKLWRRGTPNAFARLVTAIGPGPGCLYVYAGDPMLYAAVPRCTLTRFQFPSHLTRQREAGAIGVDQSDEIARILAARPAVIVDTGQFRGELPARRAQLMRAIAERYTRVAQVAEGFSTASVYRLRGKRQSGFRSD